MDVKQDTGLWIEPEPPPIVAETERRHVFGSLIINGLPGHVLGSLIINGEYQRLETKSS